MENSVVSLGKKLNFICKQKEYGNWEIISPVKGQNWKLSRVGERWRLSLNNIPQMYLSDQDAILFLRSR